MNEIIKSESSIVGASQLGAGEIIPAITSFIDSTLKSYTDIKINADIQATERMRIRNHAKVLITKIEADNSAFLEALKREHELKDKIVDAVCTLATRSEIDDNTLRLCQMLLEALSNVEKNGDVAKFLTSKNNATLQIP